MQFGPIVDFQGVDFRNRSVTQPVVRTSLLVSAGVFACLGITSVYKISTRGIQMRVNGESSSVQMLNANNLPDTIGEWNKVGDTPSRDGHLIPQDSKLWSHRNEDSVLPSGFENASDVPGQLWEGDSRDAMLMYGMVEETGKPFDPPQVFTATEIARKYFRSVSDRLIRIQGWTTSLTPIIDAHRRSVEQLFQE